MSDSLRVQVLIVGSGAGGATTALELAKAGFQVVVLEEGFRHDLTTYGAGSTGGMKLLYRNRGMTPIMGKVPIGFVEGRCMGGSTEINSGFWHRLTPEFALRWKAQYDLNDFSTDILEPHFEWAEQQLHVQLREKPWPKSTEVFQRGVDAMGWSAAEAARAADQCVDTNRCSSGCPKRAKQGMSFNLIPQAEQAGAQFLPGCKVKILLKDRQQGKVTGVLADMVKEDGSRNLVRIDAEHVFLCAGPTQTPSILRRSGVKYHIGDTFQIHPMLKVSALFDEQINAQDSVMPLLHVKEFWPEISLGGSFFSAGHLAMGLSENWPSTRNAIKEYRNMATYYVAVRATGRGTVRPSPLGDEGPTLRYEISDLDVHHLSQGLARLSTMLLEAGAKEVYPCVQGLPKITSQLDAVKWLDQPIPRNALSLTTVHAFSSCPIGEREDRCAADSFGKIYGFENLYVNDASMLPDSPGINPQATVMAVARRNAHHFIHTHSSK